MVSSEEERLGNLHRLDPVQVSNILFLVPTLHRGDLTGCMDLLTIDEPAAENVWSLGVTLSPNKRVENWERVVGTKPASFKIVSIGNHPEDKAKEVAESYDFDPEPKFVTVPHGSDLTQIGVELIESLNEWEASSRRTVVCFHSISALLQYVSFERTFQFLNTFTNQIEQADAVAHYHMNPEAHNHELLSKISQLFDARVELDPNDQWEVTIR